MSAAVNRGRAGGGGLVAVYGIEAEGRQPVAAIAPVCGANEPTRSASGSGGSRRGWRLAEGPAEHQRGPCRWRRLPASIVAALAAGGWGVSLNPTNGKTPGAAGL